MEFNVDNFFDSLLLMGVGLATVFAVLLLIIWLGGLLINMINKYAPEEEKPKANLSTQNNAIDANVAQAISLAISQISGGKSKVEKIEKL